VSSSPSFESASTRAPAVAPDVFRQACALFASGVAIATVRAQDGVPHGLTISSFSAVSIQPPLILFCIDSACPFITHFRQGTHFAINILAESQRELAVTFAEKPDARFEGIAWSSGETGAPLVRASLATLECRMSSIIEAGDHAIFIGEVERAATGEGKPLLYFNRGYRTLG